MKRIPEYVETVTCHVCAGSGEGIADGLICETCGGSGELDSIEETE